jgi:hypothetical protein
MSEIREEDHVRIVDITLRNTKRRVVLMVSTISLSRHFLFTSSIPLLFMRITHLLLVDTSSSSEDDFQYGNSSSSENMRLMMSPSPPNSFASPTNQASGKIFKEDELTHNWEIRSDELKFLKSLSEGSSARVYKGIYRQQDVAIKVLKLAGQETKSLDDFKKEFSIMRLVPSSFFFLLPSPFPLTSPYLCSLVLCEVRMWCSFMGW